MLVFAERYQLLLVRAKLRKLRLAVPLDPNLVPMRGRKYDGNSVAYGYCSNVSRLQHLVIETLSCIL